MLFCFLRSKILLTRQKKKNNDDHIIIYFQFLWDKMYDVHQQEAESKSTNIVFMVVRY